MKGLKFIAILVSYILLVGIPLSTQEIANAAKKHERKEHVTHMPLQNNELKHPRMSRDNSVENHPQIQGIPDKTSNHLNTHASTTYISTNINNNRSNSSSSSDNNSAISISNNNSIDTFPGIIEPAVAQESPVVIVPATTQIAAAPQVTEAPKTGPENFVYTFMALIPLGLHLRKLAKVS